MLGLTRKPTCTTERLIVWSAILAVAAFFASSVVHKADSSLPADTVRMSHQDGVAIQGYDPVAYFTDGAPLKGEPTLRADWGGVVWHFTTPENRDHFLDDPERFAPRLGGHSVYGVVRGKTYTADPRVFDIIEGRLYLSRNENVREIWQRNPDGYLRTAEERWQDGL